MRIAAGRPALAVSVLLLSASAASPAAGDVQSIKYSYPGNCAGTAARTAGPTDPVTLILGELLDLEIAGSGLAGGAPAPSGGASLKQAAAGPHVVAPEGVEAAVVSASPKAMKVRLLFRRGDPPPKSSPSVKLRIVDGTATLGEFLVRLAARPRVQRIRLAIPGTAGYTTVLLAPGGTFALAVAGRGLSELEVELGDHRAFPGLRKVRDGVFEYSAGAAMTKRRLGPEAFLWRVDGCGVTGPSDAGMDVEIGSQDGWSVKIENHLATENATCGAEVRSALPPAWCAPLPPAQPRSEAVVNAPNIHWTLTAKSGVIVGASTAVLRAGNAVVDHKDVSFLLPGQSVSFETPRTDGRRRRVFIEQACHGCWDLGGVPAWTEPAWTVSRWKGEKL